MSTQQEWERVAGQLRAYRTQQQEDWGGVDEALLARYLLGTATIAERERVEQAKAAYPKVAQCIALIGGIS